MEEKGIGLIGFLIIYEIAMFYLVKAYKWCSGILAEFYSLAIGWFNTALESITDWVGFILAIFGI